MKNKNKNKQILKNTKILKNLDIVNDDKFINDLIENHDEKFKSEVEVPNLKNIKHNKLLFPSWLTISSISGEKIKFEEILIEKIPKFITEDIINLKLIKARMIEFSYFSYSIGRLIHMYNLTLELINKNQGLRTYENNSGKNMIFKVNKPFCDKLVLDLFEKHYSIKISSDLGSLVSNLLYQEVSERIQKFFEPPVLLSQEEVNRVVYSSYLSHVCLNTPVETFKNCEIKDVLNVKKIQSFKQLRPVNTHKAARRLPTQTSSCVPNMIKKVDDRNDAIKCANGFIDRINESDSTIRLLLEESQPCVCFSRNPVSLGGEGLAHRQIFNMQKLKFEPQVSSRIIFGGPHREIIIETTLVRSLIDLWSENRNDSISLTAIGRRAGLIPKAIKQKREINKFGSNKTLNQHSIDYRSWDSRLHPLYLLCYYASVSTVVRTNQKYSYKVLKYIALYMVFTPIILNDYNIIYLLRGNYSGGESTTSINCFINVANILNVETDLNNHHPKLHTFEVMGDDNLWYTTLTLEQIKDKVSKLDFVINDRKSFTTNNPKDNIPYLGFYWVYELDFAPMQSIGWLIGRSVYPERFITNYGEYPIWIDRMLSLGMHLYNGWNFTYSVLSADPTFKEILNSPDYRVNYLGPDGTLFKKTFPIGLFQSPDAYLVT